MTRSLPTVLTCSIRFVLVVFLLCNSLFLVGPWRQNHQRDEVVRTSTAFAHQVIKQVNDVGLTRNTTLKSAVSILLPAAENPIVGPSLCSREQVQDGHWHSIRLDKPPYIPPNHPQLTCGPPEMYHQDYFDSYEWRPHDESCDFMPWNKDMFCNLLHHQTILFMGDSLSQEAMFSFGELLGLRYSADDSKENPLYNFSAACNGTLDASFRRDDKLSPDKVAWELQEKMPTVAVLNRGAHITKDDRLLKDVLETLKHVRDWQDKCQSLGRRCLLVWRTTVPGHPKCGKFREPTTNRTYMERLVQIIPRSRGYGWHEFQRQNLLVEQALGESGVEYEMLDAYDVNILRPDSHRTSENDCLHSCLGSKLDVYSQLLLHILRRKREMELAGNVLGR